MNAFVHGWSMEVHRMQACVAVRAIAVLMSGIARPFVDFSCICGCVRFMTALADGQTLRDFIDQSADQLKRKDIFDLFS